MEIYGYNFQSFHKCFLCGAAAGVLGRCFPRSGSLVRYSDDASWSAEALSDTRTMLPEERKPCQILGRCFLKRGSPVRYSDDTSREKEAPSDEKIK